MNDAAACLTTLAHYRAAVDELAFAADGETLLSLDAAYVARTWDVRTGRERFRFAHSGRVDEVVYATDGTRVATRNEAIVKVWETATGKQAAELIHDDRVEKLAISPDGTRLATVKRDQRAVEVFKIEATLSTPNAPAPLLFSVSHQDYVRLASFSADSTRLITASREGNVQVSDAMAGKTLALLQVERDVEKAVLSDDNAVIAVLVSDSGKKYVDLRDVPIGRRLAILPIKYARELAFRPGTRTLAIATGEPVIRVLDAEPARSELTRVDVGRKFRDATISADGTLVALRREDGREAEVREVATGRQRLTFAHDDEVWEVTMSPDATRLATGSKDKTARIWDAVTGQELLRLAPPEGYGSLKFSPDGRRLLTMRSKTSPWDETELQVIDAATGTQVGQPIAGYVSNMIWSPDGRYLATAEGETYPDNPERTGALGFFGARIWDAETGIEVVRLPHDWPVGKVAFSPDGKWLASASTRHYGQPVRLWDVHSGSLLAEIARPLGRMNYVRSFAFSPDGQHLAVSSENEISVWRLADAARVATMPLEGSAEQILFSPDGGLIAAGADKNVWVLDWSKQRPIVRLSEVRGYAGEYGFTPDSARLVAVHEDGTVRVWQLRADDLIADACFRLERNLTREEWKSYVGEEKYRTTCSNLPVPEK